MSRHLMKMIPWYTMHAGGEAGPKRKGVEGEWVEARAAFLERGEDKSGMWLGGIGEKVCTSPSHSLDLSWGRIPHGAERKPA